MARRGIGGGKRVWHRRQIPRTCGGFMCGRIGAYGIMVQLELTESWRYRCWGSVSFM